MGRNFEGRRVDFVIGLYLGARATVLSRRSSFSHCRTPLSRGSSLCLRAGFSTALAHNSSMESNIAQMCAQMSLTEQEEAVLVVEEEEILTPHRSDKCLLFKLLSDKHFNKEAFKSTMTQLWRPSKALSIQDISPNLFLAEFDDIGDKKRVQREGPWIFDKHLVVTKDVEGLEQLHNISFTAANFWIPALRTWTAL
ncbi:unnamed protein product [Fraxinus pennsylvanica]|uniref:DUF4283 domain-containing protein n=1 Tax=Fraxinus pennsylvanica TaxID=56036 RepID=A0AAD1ZEB9_9LAMI|nr:unnamed protein product [Fraxinus pennsylvanica]